MLPNCLKVCLGGVAVQTGSGGLDVGSVDVVTDGYYYCCGLIREEQQGGTCAKGVGLASGTIQANTFT